MMNGSLNQKRDDDYGKYLIYNWATPIQKEVDKKGKASLKKEYKKIG